VGKNRPRRREVGERKELEESLRDETAAKNVETKSRP
jgi:hypothetical protein